MCRSVSSPWTVLESPGTSVSSKCVSVSTVVLLGPACLWCPALFCPRCPANRQLSLSNRQLSVSAAISCRPVQGGGGQPPRGPVEGTEGVDESSIAPHHGNSWTFNMDTPTKTSQTAHARTSCLPPCLNSRVSMVTVLLCSETSPPMGEMMKFRTNASRLSATEQEVTSSSVENAIIHMIL